MSESATLRASALLLAFTLAGCGGISTPNLAQGDVEGRLTGTFVAGAAYAYALGSPGTKTLLAADGSYTLEGVPVGAVQVVLFDGASRADTVPVEVRGAEIAHAADVDASALATARTVFAAVRCDGGSSGANASYSVDGAALSDGTTGEVATLFPLPPGLFTVRASLAGFSGGPEEVDLTQETSAQIEFGLGVNDGDGNRRGCLSNSCSAGLYCGGDGRCYACTSDDQCGTGAQCIDHLCAAPSLRSSCAPCTTSADCSAGPAGQAPMCVSAPPDVNVCSHACSSDQDCAAGFTCASLSGGSACVAVQGCSALFQAFHSPCFSDASCAQAGLSCWPAQRNPDAIGFCTAPCTTDADCPAQLGYTCNASAQVCWHQ